MKGFYDKIIPDAANKLGKQWGEKVGKIDFGGRTFKVQRRAGLRTDK